MLIIGHVNLLAYLFVSPCIQFFFFILCIILSFLRDVLFLLPNVLIFLSSWISNGVVGSPAFAAFDQGMSCIFGFQVFAVLIIEKREGICSSWSKIL